MSTESLLSAAQLLEEQYFIKGDVIIKQDDFGDTFYILEEGE
jgi:CRP-like cAMP-binding protein